jgi:hypothetical protein
LFPQADGTVLHNAPQRERGDCPHSYMRAIEFALAKSKCDRDSLVVARRPTIWMRSRWRGYRTNRHCSLAGFPLPQGRVRMRDMDEEGGRTWTPDERPLYSRILKLDNRQF